MRIKKPPSARSLHGLNWMIFFMSDVRPGIGPFLAIFLTSHLLWGTDKVGIALGAVDLTAAICQIPCGLLVDSFKMKRLLIFAASLAISIACLIILSSSQLSEVLFAQVLIGIAAAIIPPSIAAITLGLVGGQRFPKRVSINETWGHAGNVVTAGIVGLLGFLLGVEWIVRMVIVFATISVFFLLWIRPQEIDHRIARALPEGSVKLRPQRISQLLRETPLLIFCASVLLFHLANAAQLPLVGQLLAQKSPRDSSLFMGGSIILAQTVMIAVAYTTGICMKFLGRKPIFLIAMGILPIRAILFTLTDHPIVLLSIQLLDGVGAGIFGVIAVVIVSDIAHGTGRFNLSLGIMALSQGIGASLSNFTSGLVVHYLGFHAGFYLLACLAILGAGFFAWFMPETKNANFHPSSK